MLYYHGFSGANKDETPLSVFSVVRRLREQRVYMCQTYCQYEYIYYFLNNI